MTKTTLTPDQREEAIRTLRETAGKEQNAAFLRQQEQCKALVAQAEELERQAAELRRQADVHAFGSASIKREVAARRTRAEVRRIRRGDA
jgi:hypothetical protein